MFYEETFEDDRCQEIKTKKDLLSFINDNQKKDGSCISYDDEFKIIKKWASGKSVQYYCAEEGILAYVYNDESCKEDNFQFLLYENNCFIVEGVFKRFICDFEPYN